MRKFKRRRKNKFCEYVKPKVLEFLGMFATAALFSVFICCMFLLA